MLWSRCSLAFKPTARGKGPLATPGMLKLVYIREPVVLCVSMFEAGKAADQGAGTAFDYTDVQYRGDYFLLDSRMAAVPSAGEAATAHLVELLDPVKHVRITEIFLIKPKED